MSDDELAAVIAAVQALMQQTAQPDEPQVSAWKRQARLEAAVGVQ